MALPTSYLTTTKNLDAILNAMRSAQAPKQFSQSFLQALGFKGSGDRLIINVLKQLGFLTGNGTPTQRYFEFLDQTQSGRVLAEALQEAYGDLYEVSREAHNLSKTEIKNKLKTLTQGKYSEDVLNKMATTFLALASKADFEAAAAGKPDPGVGDGDGGDGGSPDGGGDGGNGDGAGGGTPPGAGGGIPLNGLVYSIQIHLPESRDQAVYDAIFASLKTHLFQ